MRRLIRPLLFALLTLWSVAATLAAKPDVVRVGYLNLVNAQLVTKHLEMLSSEMGGVEVKYVKMGNPGDMLRALAAGQVDFGSLGNPPAAIGITRGIPVKGILVIDVLGSVEGLVVRKEAGIESLADLKGHRIATVFGSTTHYELLNALREEGVDPATMKIVDLGPADIANAWARGDIDAAYFWEPNLQKTVAAGGRIYVDSRTMAQKGYPTWDVDVVQTDFAKQYPDYVRAFVKAGCDGIDYWRAHPDKTADIVAKELSLPKKDAVRMIAGTRMVPCGEQLSAKYLGGGAAPSGFAKALHSTAEFLVAQDRLPKLLPQSDFSAFLDPAYLKNVTQD